MQLEYQTQIEIETAIENEIETKLSRTGNTKRLIDCRWVGVTGEGVAERRKGGGGAATRV